MTARQIIVPGAMPSRDANGRALPAKFRFYLAGTNTPTTVYEDAGLTTPHEFPILSDAGGRWPQIWADDTLTFNVGWSDQVFDGLIKTFENIKPLSDALLASADIANAAADAAVAAQAQAEAIAEQFGDVDAAITAAQAAQAGAEAAQAGAETAQGAAETAQAAAEAAQAAAEQAAEDAEAIAGFDVTKIVRVDIAQSFSAGEQAQARSNIGAQPVLGLLDRQKVSRPAISSGALTLDCAAASVFEVEWDANITSLTLSNLAAGTDSQTITLILVGDGGTTFTPGAAFKVIGDPPSFVTSAGARNYLTLTTRNAGTLVDYAFAGAALP